MFFQVALIKLLFFFYFTDKRNSTGNLYFEGGNSQDPGGLSTISNSLQQGSARILRGLSGSQPVGVRDSNSSLSSMNSDYDPNDPQAMFSRELRTAAGKLTSFFVKECCSYSVVSLWRFLQREYQATHSNIMRFKKKSSVTLSWKDKGVASSWK